MEQSVDNRYIQIKGTQVFVQFLLFFCKFEIISNLNTNNKAYISKTYLSHNITIQILVSIRDRS